MVIREMDGQPMRWQDESGVMHAVEGDHVDPGKEILLLWPVCGQGDVPANRAWKGFDAVTCAGCIEALEKPDA